VERILGGRYRQSGGDRANHLSPVHRAGLDDALTREEHKANRLKKPMNGASSHRTDKIGRAVASL